MSCPRRHRVAVALVILTTVLAIVGLLHDETSLSAAIDVYEVTSSTQGCSLRDHARIQALITLHVAPTAHPLTSTPRV